MPTAHEFVQEAFGSLAKLPGFQHRADQVQLALLLSDLIQEGSSGAIEAPTGLGKSIAALIPAIAQAMASGKRTVIATYTNVLAEQYWRKDLPLALSLFEGAGAVKCAFLIGRQRYVCLAGMAETMPSEVPAFQSFAELGIEAEFRNFSRNPLADMGQLWQKVSTPPVCPARLCTHYHDCYFYGARQRAESASIVITNHSVVLQDALNSLNSDEGSGMLGPYDFLIVDEAHDLIHAAQSGLEFDLSSAELNVLKGIAGRLRALLEPLASAVGHSHGLDQAAEEFQNSLERTEKDLAAYAIGLREAGILATSPPELMAHPQLERQRSKDGLEGARSIAASVSDACAQFTNKLRASLETWETYRPDLAAQARESARNYFQYIDQMGGEASALFDPVGVAVSYVRSTRTEAELRSDTVGLAEPLASLLWSRKPAALLSATMTVDGSFDFLNRTLGFAPHHTEVLPTPFDFRTQAAVYLPKAGRIPDPTLARNQGTEEAYYDALADEVRELLLAVGGRSLVLFHSRKEMEAVAGRIELPPDLPILIQSRSGASTTGERFRRDVRSSLFALRSFWTGFDAPGETLTCVALVRVPFEVPVEPPAVARMAYLESQGLNSFAAWTLPNAKMMIRQGAGRLIRSPGDKGIVALLDPRLRTKRYGEEILANLPAGMRTFDDVLEAVAWIGV